MKNPSVVLVIDSKEGKFPGSNWYQTGRPVPPQNPSALGRLPGRSHVTPEIVGLVIWEPFCPELKHGPNPSAQRYDTPLAVLRLGLAHTLAETQLAQ
jgi:hypothetical protein